MNPLNSIILMLATGRDLLGGLVIGLLCIGIADQKGKEIKQALYDEYYADPAVKRAMAKIKEANAHPNFGETGLGLPSSLFQELKTAELVLQQRHPRLY